MRGRPVIRIGSTFLAFVAPFCAAKAALALGPTVTVQGGAGFNDTTPATPVGGNTGTTVGAQRLFVFQKAAAAWASKLDSTVPLLIKADFSSLGCDAGGAVLGHAGSTYSVPLDVAGYPNGTYFPLPLARHLMGKADISAEVQGVTAAVSDITASFNSDLGKSGCAISTFYYGIDGQGSSQNPDLYATVLHELGHGLGFSSGVDSSTGGEQGGGELDVFSRHIADLGTGASWTTLTNAQRRASYINARKVVWDGENVRRQAREILAPGSPSLTFTPALNGFSTFVSEGDFGNWDASGSWTGPVAEMADCARAGTGSPLSGKIALVTSNSCPGLQSASTAQTAGARAVILVDFNDQRPPDTSRASPSQIKQYPVHIPVAVISASDAQLIVDSTASLSATLAHDPEHLVGADAQGRPFLFTPNPGQPGSSVSHWDILARPDLVQEPVEPIVAPTDISMELALFRDLGWRTLCGNQRVDPGEDCDDGSKNGDGTSTCSCRCTRAGSTGMGGKGGGGGSATGGSGAGGTGNTGGTSTGGKSGTGGATDTGGMSGNSTGGSGTTLDAGAIDTTTGPLGELHAAPDVIGGCSCGFGEGSGVGSDGLWLVGLAATLFAQRKRPRR